MAESSSSSKGNKRSREASNDAASSDHDEKAKVQKLECPRRMASICRANSRYWKQVVDRSKRWLAKTTPYEPSFTILYWKKSRGRNPVVWAGPEHMREFGDSKVVKDLFMKVATDSSSIPITPAIVKSARRLKLHSKDVELYRSDHLYKLISEIVNPGNRRNFFTLDSNKPQWYPKKVPFKAPNHKSKDGQPRLNAVQNRKILAAYLHHCPDQYEIISASGDESSTAESSEDDDDDFKPSSRPSLVHLNSPQQALLLIYTAEDWPALVNYTEQAKKDVNLDCLQGGRLRKMSDIPESFFDRSLANQVPLNYQALLATGDGNCLYNSMSTLLYGQEEHSTHLRLASVIHAVSHVDHYIAMLKQAIPETAVAVQFLSTVSSSTATVERRPKINPSIDELHMFTLFTQIIDTAKVGRDAGFLQLLFLAGATNYPIQQHSSQAINELYRLLVPPCCCADFYEEVVHIMWINFGGDQRALPNHLIPLIACLDDADDAPAKLELSLSTCIEIEETCLMWGKCYSSLASQEKSIGWVICDTCHSWYHSACVGLATKLTSRDDFNFSCCASPQKNEVVFHWPLKTKRGVSQSLLTLSDVQSLYPWNGISDAVIDFYIRVLLPASDTVASLGPLTYEAVKRYPTDDQEALSRANRNINGTNFDLKKPLILFPCKPRTAWHWMLVAFVTTVKKAYVLDSLSDHISPSSSEVITNIQHFLATLGVTAETFTPFPLKICRQKTSTDCGLHVLHNMTLLSELSIEAIETTTKFKEDFSAMEMRRTLLEKSHELSGKYVKHRISTSTKLEATKRDILARIYGRVEGGLKVVEIKEKGRSVITDRPFGKGEFICHYDGELIKDREARMKNAEYSDDKGSYQFYFEYNGEKLCIDATVETGSIGRLINHSKTNPNLEVKVITSDDGRPYLCMFAKSNIPPGAELVYDYGERASSAIESFQWLKE